MKIRPWSALALVLVLVAWGIGDKERGNRLYRAGDYAGAAAAYEKALKDGDDSPALHYDYATTLLRLGKYTDAEQHFKAALKNVEPDLRERTLYNLGNRYLYQARSTSTAAAGSGAGPTAPAAGAAGAPDNRALLDAAIKAYQEALRIDSKDGDAKWNLELALKDRQQKGMGGGAQQNKGGGGGGGRQKNPTPQGQGNENDRQNQRNQMSQAQADRILSAAENDERQLYKDKVRKGNREVPVTRDW